MDWGRWGGVRLQKYFIAMFHIYFTLCSLSSYRKQSQWWQKELMVQLHEPCNYFLPWHSNLLRKWQISRSPKRQLRKTIFINMAKGFLNITKWSVFPELTSNHREIASFQGNKNWSILWSFCDCKFDSVLLELERQFREIICDRFKKIGISIEKHRNET